MTVFDMIEEFLASKGLIIALAFLLLFGLERAFPVARWLGGTGRIFSNLVLAFINTLMSPLIVIPLTAWAASHALDWRPLFWSGWFGLLVDLVVLDLWIYGWHRLNHVNGFLWRFHEVHHLDAMLDASSALRFHFGEVLLSALVRAAVIFVLDIPLQSVVVFEVIVALSALFHHSNLRLPGWLEGKLSYLIVTPSLHWVHHHAKREDTDSNYATVLSVWDRVFASRSATRRSVDMPIGVEGKPEKNLAALLGAPFQS